MKLTNFFFDIRLSIYWQNAFVKILLKTGLIDKNLEDWAKIIQVWLTLGKPIANGNSSMITWTDKPLPCWTFKKEWKFKCKSWIKKTHRLLLLTYQNTSWQLTSCIYAISFLIFISNSADILQINWIFYHISKKGYFLSHENITSYAIWNTTVLARLSIIPHYQKKWTV